MRHGCSRPGTVTVHVPMTFVLRGGRKAVLSEFTQPAPSPRTESALLKALARAYRWRKQIEEGEYASVAELARAQKVNESYACRLLRLTLLSPELVSEILDGRQSSDVTLRQLAKPLPIRWDEQIRLLDPGQSRILRPISPAAKSGNPKLNAN